MIVGMSYEDIPSRGISAKVCKSHGYGIAEVYGQLSQVANYRDASGAVVGQKIKQQGKKFSVRGSLKTAGFWQQSRWKGGKKRLLVTEGETDLLAWQSVSGDRFPGVSLPLGASSAAKVAKEQVEYLESFEMVILCFDADEAGRKAAEEFAAVLRPGKAAIMHLPDDCNDICEAVAAKKGQELQDAFWNASPLRPDGILAGQDLLDALLTPPSRGDDYPWQGLTDMLMGIRMKELVTMTAGTGVGKSLMAGLVAHGLVGQGRKIGYISLEESLTRTVERLVGAQLKKPLHVSREGVTDEELVGAWKETFDGNVVVYNHFGSTDSESLLNRVRFMRIAEGVDFVVVDHLSILVSGWGDGDERRLIDNVMTSLRSICEQTGVGMILISHLSAPKGTDKSHEEGGRPKLQQLRGSKSIGQLSDAVIAIQRDQLDDEDGNTSKVWVLKNRHSGTVGLACVLDYDPKTGLMEEKSSVDCPF